MMPEMNGYEFFEAVRLDKNWTAIPFMFLTAKGEKSDIRAGMSIGADDYVTKPFAAEELIDAVEARLRRHKELQVLRDTQVNDVKRNIMTILNHEFRTPLTYVVAYADMLNRDAETLSYGDIKMFLQGVNAGADRLRRLIENFILLVELETGESERTYNCIAISSNRPLATWQLLPPKRASKSLSNQCRPVSPQLKAIANI
jgi:CheY-like chemotaxis protein